MMMAAMLAEILLLVVVVVRMIDIVIVIVDTVSGQKNPWTALVGIQATKGGRRWNDYRKFFTRLKEHALGHSRNKERFFFGIDILRTSLRSGRPEVGNGTSRRTVVHELASYRTVWRWVDRI